MDSDMINRLISFRNRITDLRIKKNVSEYKMSLDLGHSKSYIQSISSGKSLPSLVEFWYICDYLGISPNEFFDFNDINPQLIKELINKASTLSDSDIELLISIAERLNSK